MKMEHVLASKGSQVYTTSPDTPLPSALSELAEHNIGALIVVDETGKPIGILSERDVIRAKARGVPLDTSLVGDLMTADIVTGTPADDVESVQRTMTTNRFRHLPIVAEGRLVGMVTLGDLVKAQLNEARGTVETLEAQIMSEAPGL